MTTVSAPLLHVQDLRVSYTTARGPFMAVAGVSFTLNAGETFGLVGESGSGKTTTAMAILRMIKPPGRIEGGRALLDGVDLMAEGGESLRRLRWTKISMIPQGAMNALNPVLRIREQIGDAIITHEGAQSREKLRERIVELLKTVGLPERVYTMYPHELSGGMKQRVCIAMAIALSPRLIVADEPTSALDVVVQRVVAETLKDVQARLKAGVLLIGHDMGLQAQLVDRLGVMYRGRLVEVGPVRQMFKDPLHPYTQLLIASIPSIKGAAERGLSDALRKMQAALPASAADIPALREIHPEHFVALA